MATVTQRLRLNIGCGEFPLPTEEGWINIDSDVSLPADIHLSVPPIPANDNDVDEIAAIHFFEHLERVKAKEFLTECYRVLKPGGLLGIVVPDTFAICREYVRQSNIGVEFPEKVWRNCNDLDEVCALFLYSTLQDSPHRWSYDITTLGRAMKEAGFHIVGPIDRWHDPRLGTGQWYQTGLDATKL